MTDNTTSPASALGTRPGQSQAICRGGTRTSPARIWTMTLSTVCLLGASAVLAREYYGVGTLVMLVGMGLALCPFRD